MKYEILGFPFSYLEVKIEPGEKITAEAGSFMYGIGEYEIETKTYGILKGLMRSLLAGESLFLNTFIAKSRSTIAFASNLPGRIIPLQLNGEEWYLNDRAYLAHYGNIDVSTKFLGLRGLLTRWNLFWIKVAGEGIVWINAYGEIVPLEIPEGTIAKIDNSQILAFPSNANYKIKKFGGLKSFLFGGEGIIVEIQGPAKIYIQTRSLDQFASVLGPYLTK